MTLQVTVLGTRIKIVNSLHPFSQAGSHGQGGIDRKSAGHRHGDTSGCAAMSGVLGPAFCRVAL